MVSSKPTPTIGRGTHGFHVTRQIVLMIRRQPDGWSSAAIGLVGSPLTTDLTMGSSKNQGRGIGLSVLEAIDGGINLSVFLYVVFSPSTVLKLSCFFARWSPLTLDMTLAGEYYYLLFSSFLPRDLTAWDQL